MQNETIYMAKLPDSQIPFSSPEGVQLFHEAFLDGGAKPFFKLIEQFHTQLDPGYCGLGSLAMILNTLAIDPNRCVPKLCNCCCFFFILKRQWKGIFRWYTEELLDCCVPLEQSMCKLFKLNVKKILKVRKQGITVNQFHCLALCNNATCSVKYGSESNVNEFREAVESVTYKYNEQDPKYLVVSFDRRAVSQLGIGHYSPIAIYHKKRDMVLVLDVARFKYPPYFIKVEDLFNATLPIDVDSGKSRAYMVLGRNIISEKAVFARINSADLSIYSKFRLELFSKLQFPVNDMSSLIKGFVQASISCPFVSPVLLQRNHAQQQKQKHEEVEIPNVIGNSSCNSSSSCCSCSNNCVPHVVPVPNVKSTFDWKALSPEHLAKVQILFESVKETQLYKNMLETAVNENLVQDASDDVSIVLHTILFAAIPFDNSSFNKNLQSEKLLLEWKALDKEIQQKEPMWDEVNALRSQLYALAAFSCKEGCP